MGLDELLALPVVVDLETAGRAFGVGRTLSYQLARREEFPCPVLRLGRSYRVRKADLMHELGVCPEDDQAQAEVPEEPAAAGPVPGASVQVFPVGGIPVVLAIRAVLHPENVLEIRR